MMAIKSKLGDGKGETACIICALVGLALLFAGSIALVVILHAKDIKHSRTGDYLPNLLYIHRNVHQYDLMGSLSFATLTAN